jgi:hypothetical protein
LTAVDGGRTISLWKAPDLAASAARLWLSKAKRSGCLSRESVLLRDHFGAIELTKIFEARALLDSVAQRIEAGTCLLMQRDVREHGHAGHALRAGRYYNVLCAGHNRLRGELDGLL